MRRHKTDPLRNEELFKFCTGWYYLRGRYYDPTTCRFISADVLLSTGQGVIGHNSFAYCLNNPIKSVDSDGKLGVLATLAVRFLVGVATQYVGDVIKNVAQHKKGWDIFKPTSSVGEYIAAGVSSLIPGSGLGKAAIRSGITETIKVGEKLIRGEKVDVKESIKDFAIGTVVDWGFGKLSDKIGSKIDSKMPKNYSSHAHKIRLRFPDATKTQIIRSMRRIQKAGKYAGKTIDFIFGGIGSAIG